VITVTNEEACKGLAGQCREGVNGRQIKGRWQPYKGSHGHFSWGSRGIIPFRLNEILSYMLVIILDIKPLRKFE
jgi:hypothetical protein